MSASPLLCLTVSEKLDRFAIGAADGSIYVYFVGDSFCR